MDQPAKRNGTAPSRVSLFSHKRGHARRHTSVLTTLKKSSIVSLCAGSLFALSCGGSEETTGPGGSGLGGDGGRGSIDGGSGSGNGTGNDICMATTVGTGRGSPDMLIVLDRSGSMRMGGVNRWDPSVSGIKAITASLGDRISFGLMAFPGTGSGGGGTTGGAASCNGITDPFQYLACIAMNAGGGGGGTQGGSSCQAGSLNVPIAPNNAAVIAAALDAMRPNGATPTAVTLEAAHAELGAAGGGTPDQAGISRYVLLVTDGAPNCSGGSNGGQDSAAVDASVAAIAAMAADGIKTYVLGYGTQNDPQLKSALDRMAVAGNTGDSMHRPVEDEASLVSTFEQISGSVISCNFKLDNTVMDPRKVKVTLDQKQLNIDTADGWVLGADFKTVTLQGKACQTIKEEGHLVNVTVQCEPVIPLF